MKNPEERKQTRKRRLLHRTKRYTKTGMLWVWRALLLLLMLVLMLVCAGWLWFIQTFNAQHISERITEQLQKQLNRPVMISSIDLKFINTVELKGFYVVDTVGEPGKPFIAADSVTLNFELLPLLEQKLVIHEVTLNAPRFNLVRTQEGVYNIPHIELAKRESSVYTSDTGKKFEISIEDWSLKDGIFSFKDLVTQATHSLYGVDAHFDNLRFDEFSPFTLDMVLRNQWEEHISEIDIEATGQINFADFNWRNFAVRDFKTQIYLFKKPVDVKLNLNNLVEPTFTLTVTAPAFESADVSLFGLNKMAFAVPNSSLTASGAITDSYRKVAIEDVNATVGDIKLTGKGTLDFTQDPFTLQGSYSTQPFTLSGKEAYWKKLKQYQLSGKAAVSGTVAHANGKLSWPLVTVQADQVSGDFYGFKTHQVSGTFQAKSNFTDLYARTTGGKVMVDRSNFDKLQLSASWRKGTLYANIASTELNEDPFKMNVTIQNLTSDQRKINTNLHFHTFDPMRFIETVRDFVTVIAPLTKGTQNKPEVTGELAWLRNFRDRLPNFMPNLAGTLSADVFSSGVLSGKNFNAEFNLTGLQGGAKHLSGTLDTHLEQGMIYQMEKWAEEQEALNVTFQPFIMMHRMERAGSFSVGKVLRDVQVQEMGASVHLTNGNMQINNAYTVGPTISAAVGGKTDWVQEKFDLTIYTMFTNTSKSGVLAENLTDESGNPALAFRVSGDMNKPKLEMLRAKKAGQTIRSAQAQGVNTDFSAATKFIQGEHHATK